MLGQNDDGGPGNVPADPMTGEFYDTFFTSVLAAGTYTVSVQQFNNFAIGPLLSNGFERDGQGIFTGPLFGCSQGFFCAFGGSNRDGHWAFDISGVEKADVPPVPVPAALPLMATGLAALGFLGRRRKQKAAAAA